MPCEWHIFFLFAEQNNWAWFLNLASYQNSTCRLDLFLTLSSYLSQKCIYFRQTLEMLSGWLRQAHLFDDISEIYNKIWKVKKVIRICQFYWVLCHVIHGMICLPCHVKKKKEGKWEGLCIDCNACTKWLKFNYPKFWDDRKLLSTDVKSPH